MLANLEYFVGDKPVSLAMNDIGRVGTGRFYQAEDPSCLLVYPIVLVIDSMRGLSRQIGLVGLGNIVRRNASLNVMNVHVKGHGHSSPLFIGSVE